LCTVRDGSGDDDVGEGDNACFDDDGGIAMMLLI